MQEPMAATLVSAYEMHEIGMVRQVLAKIPEGP